MKTRDAMRFLRDADPAGDLDVTPTQARTAAHRAADRLAGADLTPLPVVKTPLPGPRWHRWLPIAAAAAMVVVVAAAIAILGDRSHTSPASFGGKSSEQLTLALLTRLVNRVPQPAGAALRDSAPVASLEHAQYTSASSQAAAVTHWLVTDLAPSKLAQFYRTHLRLPLAGTDRGDSQAGATTGLTFNATATSFAADPQVLISIAARGAGSAARIDGQAIWIAPQATVAIIRPTAVRVAVIRDGLGAVQRTLDKAHAARLAHLINNLGLAPDEATSCGNASGRQLDKLDFTGRNGPVSVTADVSACPGLDVQTPGHDGINLFDPQQSVNRLVLRMLGMSSGYGRK